MKTPEWAFEYKTEGTEIKKIDNKYYLYEVTSKYDPAIKRSRKISGKCLGRITPNGVKKSKRIRMEESIKNMTVKEFGASYYILKINEDIEESLKEIFPDIWKEIYLFSLFRLCYHSPIRDLDSHYYDSYLSNILPDARLSPGYVGDMLRQIGKDRGSIKVFLQRFISGEEFALIDLTHVVSLSEGIISAVTGYNTKKEFLPQIHINFLFSLDTYMPSYFRIVPGSIRDVSSLTLTVKEAGVKNTVLITDKGFYSEDNVLELGGEGIHFIIPLKRNSSLIDYSNIKKEDKSGFQGFFFFEKRVIWNYDYEVPDGKLKGKKICVFLDPRLKTEEEKDYLLRIVKKELFHLNPNYKENLTEGIVSNILKNAFEDNDVMLSKKARLSKIDNKGWEIKDGKKQYQIEDEGTQLKIYIYEKFSFENFMKIQHRQGSISVITDLPASGERIYNLLKSRIEIEQMIDTFKNILHADRTYMRDDYQMEGWMFINFISLLFYYKIYNVLVSKELLKKYSPKKVLLELSRIRKIKVMDKWNTSEVPKSARIILEKLDISIT